VPKTENATIGWITIKMDTGEPVSFNDAILINGSLPKARRLLSKAALKLLADEGDTKLRNYRSLRVNYAALVERLYTGGIYTLDRGAFFRFQRLLRNDLRLAHMHRMPDQDLSPTDVVTVKWGKPKL
jgi:hypothetical protein